MTNPSPYRPGLPPIPPRLLRLPISRGYPVPWFVAKLDDGSYDFRVADASKMPPAIKEKRCWICGQTLGAYLVFPIGPMCAINRTTAELPSHRECAVWSAVACPFLNQREHKRREGNLPAGYVDAAGEPIARQPGVTLLWITKSFRAFKVDDGVLFRIGDPIAALWYREGRAATRAEILDSFDTGYPILEAMAATEGPKAVKMLEAMRDRALALVPME